MLLTRVRRRGSNSRGAPRPLRMAWSSMNPALDGPRDFGSHRAASLPTLLTTLRSRSCASTGAVMRMSVPQIAQPSEVACTLHFGRACGQCAFSCARASRFTIHVMFTSLCSPHATAHVRRTGVARATLLSCLPCSLHVHVRRRVCRMCFTGNSSCTATRTIIFAV